MHLSGCDIKSWTDQKARRPCRVFVLEGGEAEVVAAATIITAAVDRYKELCEGKCVGEYNPWTNSIMIELLEMLLG
jgi:hypothetical protein